MSAPGAYPRTPQAALEQLRAGNERFVQEAPDHPHSDFARRQLAATADQGDYAIATVLTCSDSRVPVEQIFDAGIMDLFVVRVAGNICGPSEAGSIEYGVAHVHTPILMVLGHTQCGAVAATMQQADAPEPVAEGPIAPILARIMPALERARGADGDDAPAEIGTRTVVENIYQAFHDLFVQTPAVRAHVRSGDVMPVPAMYDLDTGRVHWLDTDNVMQVLETAEKTTGG
ncbi:MAG: carbonic anhydrase [Candidatus Hydrogenedentota bacterium]